MVKESSMSKKIVHASRTKYNEKENIRASVLDATVMRRRPVRRGIVRDSVRRWQSDAII